jgi:superfamily II DNA/RNA helicase
MKNFEGFGLNPALAQSLAHMNYTTPTPIQAQAIPPALLGRDIMGTAQTGTGKTAAFAIPLVEALLRTPQGSALVLTPTRELGRQIMDIIHQLLGPRSPIRTAFLIGGESMGKQLSQLRQRPRIVVGTPGRTNDHLQQGSLRLGDAGFLVLDETDRMLDMGFSVQIDRILKYLPAKRQTLMFSATMPQDILKLAQKYLSNPERVAVGSTAAPASNIKQEIVRVNDTGKYDELVKQLDARTGSIIVFVRTKHGADRLARKLGHAKFSAEAIHGGLKQNRRDRVIREFRNKEHRILVATDVAARGLDIPHIEHVINYDLPQVPEDYIHRIGRTARAGAAGSALCLISPQDGEKWQAIEQLLNPGQKQQKAAPHKPHGHNRKNPRKGKRRFYGPARQRAA